MANSSDHQSREATARVQYAKLREGGVTHHHARAISEKGSAQTHRSLDRRNSSQK